MLCITALILLSGTMVCASGGNFDSDEFSSEELQNRTASKSNWRIGMLSTYQDNMTTTFVEYLTQTVSPQYGAQFTIPLKFELVILNTTSMFKAVEGKTVA
eukprot:1376066-Amorphochlora_amoeboformis.AAC.1